MEKKFPEWWLCKTTHSLGLSSWMKRSHGRPKVEKDKMRDIIRGMPDSESFPDLARAVGICKAWGIVPRGALADPTGMYPDEQEVYSNLFSDYAIDVGYHQDPVGAVRGALLRSIQVAWQEEVIDFDDMLYLPVIYNAMLPQSNIVLIDEAQDIAPIQRGMLRLMMRDGARLVAIGDDRQAIYGFRGADRHSLRKIIEEFDCDILPLTVSFRCSKRVVEEAQCLVPDIEVWDQAPEGEVAHLHERPTQEFPPGSAILCRNNAPTVAACLKFIKNGIGATIMGRDIAKGLKNLIDKQKATNLSELNIRLWDDVEHRAELLRGRGKDNQAQALADRAECISHIIAFLGKAATIWDLKKRLDAMFSDEKGLITLSTIHKAKGMEWNEVYILDRHLMPSKFARGEEELQQEYNLLYVAQTRAKEKLFYIDSEGIR
jgi:superfamily I DNA/RNA helicase